MAKKRTTQTQNRGERIALRSKLLKLLNLIFFLKKNFFRRYRDKERSLTPESVVNSAPSFKSDESKKTINIKATVKPISAATVSRAPKKIDMGAALNYGKANELGINSPTHRNTHNEDLFGDEPVVTKVTKVKTSNDIIEDIFASSVETSDDFDPRAEDTTADFGDFASVFGGNKTVSTHVTVPESNEFADFSSAFSGATPAFFAPTQATPVVKNFLFNSPTQSGSNLLGSADLFGNSVITSAFTSPSGFTASSNKDLLSDFGDLTLNPNQGEFVFANI